MEHPEMTTSSSNIDYTAPYAHPAQDNWFQRAQAWLDNKGRGAWVAAMVLGYIFVWPVGLAVMIYMIATNRFSCKTQCGARAHPTTLHSTMTSSGSSAFDAYKADTLKRLEDEQRSFEAFLKRLRDAKDKAEFDQFMDDRAQRTQDTDDGAYDEPTKL